jgi:hypothetical protein
MKPHRTDGVSLTFALLLFAVVGGWLLKSVSDVSLPGIGWMFAGALIFFGVLGLLGTRRSGNDRDNRDHQAELP